MKNPIVAFTICNTVIGTALGNIWSGLILGCLSLLTALVANKYAEKNIRPFKQDSVYEESKRGMSAAFYIVGIQICFIMIISFIKYL